MEDEFLFAENGNFLGVFDGHLGANVAKYLKNNVYEYFDKFKNNNDVPITEETLAKHLQNALLKVDSDCGTYPSLRSQGSTATIVYIFNDDNKIKYLTGNVGDSRIVLCRNDIAYELTKDHKPNDPIELKRIIDEGGDVYWDGELSNGLPIPGQGCYRVDSANGLAMSRAISDYDDKPLVSSNPDVHVTDGSDDDQFIILASDGLWDVFSSQGAANLVNSATKFFQNIYKNDPIKMSQFEKEVAALLVKKAYDGGSYDNITVIVKWLKKI
eukprot:gene20140-26149_t